MAAALGLVFFGVLIAVGVYLLVALKRWTAEEIATETRLHSPDTHTVAYPVPTGQDPAVLLAALTHAGFTCVADNVGGAERVLVACEEEDRARVREIIEQVDRTAFDGAPLHVNNVRFEDER